MPIARDKAHQSDRQRLGKEWSDFIKRVFGCEHKVQSAICLRHGLTE